MLRVSQNWRQILLSDSSVPLTTLVRLQHVMHLERKFVVDVSQICHSSHVASLVIQSLQYKILNNRRWLYDQPQFKKISISF